MSQQLPRTIQPPPDLPYMADVSDKLTGYLRNFALWCRHGFADKLSELTGGVTGAFSCRPTMRLRGTNPAVFFASG